ncbi:helix-turn-helix domain-containing protein [Aquimarina agarivorans]|uniref:helix-turn-helix domain-containing protein n=1 Tax=Aquimarina agarivorans TaxID=980584 RepID=UPI000248F87C|nr:helix-turn-helix domain-containing protein [Aquimarina agarivorans]
MNNDYYIIIPKPVYQSALNSTDMLIYGFIYSMSKKKGYCYAKNEYIQKELKITKPTLNRALKKLIDKNFVQKEFKGKIRHLKPSNLVENVSNTTLNSIKNDTSYSIKSDTHNSKTFNSKKNKLIDEFSFNSKMEKKIKRLLIDSLEHLNKRHFNISDYKIKISEQKHMGLVFNVFKTYLGDELLKSIEVIDNTFYKYLFCFYLDFRDTVHIKNRYYPYRFKGFKADDFSFELSKYKDEDYLNFKDELENNDSYDVNQDSMLNWFEDMK